MARFSLRRSTLKAAECCYLGTFEAVVLKQHCELAVPASVLIDPPSR